MREPGAACKAARASTQLAASSCQSPIIVSKLTAGEPRQVHDAEDRDAVRKSVGDAEPATAIMSA